MSKTIVIASNLGAGTGVSLLAAITGFLHANGAVIAAAVFGALLAQLFSNTKTKPKDLLIAALGVVVATFMASSFAKVPMVIHLLGADNALLCAFLFSAFVRLIFEYIKSILEQAVLKKRGTNNG